MQLTASSSRSEEGPFRLTYRLTWDEGWRLRDADLVVMTKRSTRSLSLRSDGRGHWRDGEGRTAEELDGCVDVDIWPTPFTNTLAIRRLQLGAGDRQEIDVAYIDALAGELMQKRQAYSALPGGDYQFESLESGFTARLAVDEYGLIVDYPGLFARGG